MQYKPDRREDIIKAMVEALVMMGACETKRSSGSAIFSVCILCDANSIGHPIEHGPYCPITLARRLRDGDYAKLDATKG